MFNILSKAIHTQHLPFIHLILSFTPNELAIRAIQSQNTHALLFILQSIPIHSIDTLDPYDQHTPLDLISLIDLTTTLYPNFTLFHILIQYLLQSHHSSFITNILDSLDSSTTHTHIKSLLTLLHSIYDPTLD